MTMSEPLPAQDSLPMELPSMSSPGASRAKTLALPENSAAWAKAPVPASGPRLSDLLATYDRATSSWRTSQHCLLAQVNGEADGLAEFSETWPSAGMMRNGKTYRRQPWALPIAESASGLLPTPVKQDQNNMMAWPSTAEWNCVMGAIIRKGLLPTPCASDNRDRGGPKDKSIQRRVSIGKQINLSMAFDGHLSPLFVEGMMGFPENWTNPELQPLATP